MYEKLTQTIARRPVMRPEVVQYGPWSGGLVTEYEPEQMRLSQLYEAKNMVIVGPGVMRTRNGSTLVCTGCTGSIVQVEEVNVGGTDYTVMSDTDKKLYYNNSGTATAIATLEGEPRFCEFMGFLIIFDGSYIKKWDGTDVTILYDNGTGSTTPYQLNKRTETATTNKPLGNGTITSVELAFTSQTWDAGYTIPPTYIYAKLYKVGTPTGTITAKLTTAAGVVMASKAISTTVADLTTDADGEEYEAIVTSADITTEMSPNTSYKVVLEYSGGDAANYVNVKAVDASTPILSLKPGRPPKAVFGLVFEDRIHCIEGTSGTNPSYRWYCAASEYNDWSSADGGGYTPVIDSSATNYPIGGMAAWNEDLWFFGTPGQPYLGKQSGASPSAWAINATMQKVSADYKSIVVTPDNIVFLHPAGIDMVSAVQESSDIAAESQSDNIRKTIQDYFSSAAVAGYDPEFGLYTLKMAGTSDVYVIHTRAKAVMYSGKKQRIFSPVTRWRFAYTPTAFGGGDGYMLVGDDDGKVYKMDHDVQQDNLVDIDFQFITASKPTVFGEAHAYKLGYQFFSAFGGTCNFKFYRNYSRTSFLTKAVTLPISSTTLTAELTGILTAEAHFSAFGDLYYDRKNLNFNFRNLMIGVEDIEPQGGPIYIGDIRMKAKRIGGL